MGHKKRKNQILHGDLSLPNQIPNGFLFSKPPGTMNGKWAHELTSLRHKTFQGQRFTRVRSDEGSLPSKAFGPVMYLLFHPMRGGQGREQDLSPDFSEDPALPVRAN